MPHTSTVKCADGIWQAYISNVEVAHTNYSTRVGLEIGDTELPSSPKIPLQKSKEEQYVVFVLYKPVCYYHQMLSGSDPMTR